MRLWLAGPPAEPARSSEKLRPPEINHLEGSFELACMPSGSFLAATILTLTAFASLRRATPPNEFRRPRALPGKSRARISDEWTIRASRSGSSPRSAMASTCFEKTPTTALQRPIANRPNERAARFPRRGSSSCSHRGRRPARRVHRPARRRYRASNRHRAKRRALRALRALPRH